MTYRLVVLCSALLAVLGGCDGDRPDTRAPRPPATARSVPSKPAPEVAQLAPSDPAARAAPEPPPQPALLDSPRVCTLIDCLDGFDIEVFPKQGWRAGSYRFVIEHDRKTTLCKGRLPLPPCSSRLPGITCNRRTVSMAASGCALSPSQQSFDEIILRSHPATVDIDVFRDGVRLTRAHYDVEYAETHPNGEHCGPICRAATRPGYLTLPAQPR
jgi:hypothetical protein